MINSSKKKKSDSSTGGILFAVGGYMICSALMLLINKVTITYVPAPNFMLASQLGLTAIVVWVLGIVGVIEVDALEWSKVRAFSLVSMIFLATIFTNVKILTYSHVETFIVFRASTPLVISGMDYVFLGRELPSIRSLLCLIGLLLGAYVYVMWDDAFQITGYMWISIWYCVFTVDQVYIKHVCDKVKMKSNWGRVFYSNLLPAIPLTIAAFASNELESVTWTQVGTGALLTSCVMGVAMSYFAFYARSSISATYFTVIGNVCKVITVILNQLIWDLHANAYGVGALMFCLFCAYMYKQAPYRSDYRKVSTRG